MTLIDIANNHTDLMLRMLRELVELETPSGNQDLCNRFADHLSGLIEKSEIGLLKRIAVDRFGDNLVLHVPEKANSSGNGSGMILLHYDTVWEQGTISRLPFRIEGGKAFGPGIYDMKASIVQLLFALMIIRDADLSISRPLTILFTSDEEVGSPRARELIAEYAAGSDYALVLEPPATSGGLKTARKGVGRFTVDVEGIAAHAGTQPELGRNAIVELAHQILKINSLNNPALGTTVNIGIVQGGSRSNVVPAHARAVIDVRVWSADEAERLTSTFHNLSTVDKDVALSVRGGFGRPPMPRTEQIEGMYLKARIIAEKIGLTLTEAASGGGSDANFTAAMGIPTLDGLGIAGDGAHADSEHILVQSLPLATGFLAQLLMDL